MRSLLLTLVGLVACGKPATTLDPDAAPEPDVIASDGNGDAPAADSFWGTCGDMAADSAFVDAGVPLLAARDGTMYAVVDNPGTVIARKRPGQPAELTWLTVSTQLYAVDALVDGPGGVLYFAGSVANVHALYRVDSGTITQLGPAFTGTASVDTLQYTGTGLYLVSYQDTDLYEVDLDTGARTAVVHHPGGIIHFAFGSPTTVYLASLNAPLTAVMLGPDGHEASRAPVTAFGGDAVYKVGFDQKGRIYGMTFPHGFEILDRVTDGARETIFGGNLRWSDWTFGRGALRCDLLVTSQNSSISAIQPGDQTPAWP